MTLSDRNGDTFWDTGTPNLGVHPTQSYIASSLLIGEPMKHTTKFLFMLCIPTLSVFSQTHIAVLGFNAYGVESHEALAISDRLTVELFTLGEYELVERKMLDKIIEEQKFQLSGCNSTECLVEIGKLANVEQIIGGSVSKVGKKFTLSARMVSVQTGKVVAIGTYDHRNIEFLMTEGVADIASQLSTSDFGEMGNVSKQQVIEQRSQSTPSKYKIASKNQDSKKERFKLLMSKQKISAEKTGRLIVRGDVKNAEVSIFTESGQWRATWYGKGELKEIPTGEYILEVITPYHPPCIDKVSVVENKLTIAEVIFTDDWSDVFESVRSKHQRVSFEDIILSDACGYILIGGLIISLIYPFTLI